MIVIIISYLVIGIVWSIYCAYVVFAASKTVPRSEIYKMYVNALNESNIKISDEEIRRIADTIYVIDLKRIIGWIFFWPRSLYLIFKML